MELLALVTEGGMGETKRQRRCLAAQSAPEARGWRVLYKNRPNAIAL